jgi:hypothetical protein
LYWYWNGKAWTTSWPDLLHKKMTDMVVERVPIQVSDSGWFSKIWWQTAVLWQLLYDKIARQNDQKSG